MEFDESSFPDQTFKRPTKSRAHRRLFPEYDNTSNNNNDHLFDVKKMLDEIYERKKAQWNFDFVAGVPIEGPNSNYSYTEISNSKIPSFYHTKEYIATPKTPRKQWPLIARHHLFEDQEADNGFFDDEQENRSPYKFYNLPTTTIKQPQQFNPNMSVDAELNSSSSSLLNNSTSSSVSSSSTSSFFEQAQSLYEKMPSVACASEDEAQCSSQQNNVVMPASLPQNNLILSQATHQRRSPKMTQTPMKAKATPRKRITKTPKKSPTICLNEFFTPQRRLNTTTNKQIFSDSSKFLSPFSQNVQNVTKDMSSLAVVSRIRVNARRTSVGVRLMEAAARANAQQTNTLNL